MHSPDTFDLPLQVCIVDMTVFLSLHVRKVEKYRIPGDCRRKNI